MTFEIPSVKLMFAAEKSELNLDKGVFDQYDAGLFNSRDNAIDHWKLVVDTKNWKIE